MKSSTTQEEENECVTAIEHDTFPKMTLTQGNIPMPTRLHTLMNSNATVRSKQEGNKVHTITKGMRLGRNEHV
jgi:hypothetical protein